MKHIVCALGLLIFILTIQSPEAQAACSSPSGNAGKIAYNQTAKTFQYCNGTDWIAMNQPGSGSGGCANPTLDEGYMVYNADHRVMQGCAGNVFQAMGPVDGGPSSGWAMVSSSLQHSCGIKENGTAWCWGAGNSGQLGNGTSPSYSSSPVPVSGGSTWKSVSAGSTSTCGIKSDDTGWCWGSTVLGDGTGTTTAVPVAIAGGGTWKKISVGQLHACGIKADDTAWCWGFEFYGALGNNATTATFRLSPVAVVGGHTWKDITAGDMHSCAIKSDDTARCWGYQSDGRLGNNVTFGGALATPTVVTGGFTWKKISTLYGTVCAIRSNDAAYCWGYGSYGTRGDGSTAQAAGNPVAVLGGHTWKDVVAGYMHVCGIKSDDTLWCWGYNGWGQLGDNTTTQRTSPVAIVAGGTWRAVGSGNGFTCAIRMSGKSLSCWGNNQSGQIAAGDEFGNRNSPDMVAGNASWSSIQTGAHTSCGIKTDGSGWCWGSDQFQQLGNGVLNMSQPSPSVITGGGSWKQISEGGYHTCGIKSDDTAWCWGEDGSGELGNGATAGQQQDPVAVSGGGTWKVISAGTSFSCGIKSDDTAWCWGSDLAGKLGNGATGNTDAPSAVTGGGSWKTIRAGYHSACGIKSDDTLWCWGWDSSGQLGNGATSTDQPDPVAVTGSSTWKSVALGGSHACGIKSDNTAWCWGSDSNGQIGNGVTAGNQPDPVAVNGGGTWLSISTGTSNTCGAKSDNTGWCWGSDIYGELGNGAAGTADAPTSIVGGTLWKIISAAVNGAHTCGISISDQALCWGYNSSGQLGTGTPAYSLAPVSTVCGAPYGKPGAIRYNSTEDRMQYCDSVNWVAFGGFGMGATIPPLDPCAGSPAAGTVCGDGTVYAGLSPDGNVKMFVTRCDAGQSWDGSTCTGARTNHFWNDGVNNYVATGATSLITGASNTTTITGTDANSVAGGMQQHQAAQYCADLNINGHSDWYLPAQNELAVMYANNATIGNFLTSALGHYWTSTELSANSSTYFDFQMGWDSGSLKQSVNPQRCARK